MRYFGLCSRCKLQLRGKGHKVGKALLCSTCYHNDKWYVDPLTIVVGPKTGKEWLDLWKKEGKDNEA